MPGDDTSAHGREPWPEPDAGLERLLDDRRAGRLEGYRVNPADVAEHARLEASVRQGGYQDRHLCELVQNAADAAIEADVPLGRVQVALHRGVLYVANTGAPLTGEGLHALLQAHLSPKRGPTIGRFGLGFKSVLGLSSRPEIHSRSASVRFDATEARRAIEAAIGRALRADEPSPALRLGWPASTASARASDPALDALCAWADTVVRLRLTEVGAVERVRGAIGELPAELLLFAATSLELALAEPERGVERSMRCERAGEHWRLWIGDEPSDWRRIERDLDMADAPARAREDAGDLRRERIPLVWALPVTEGRSTRGRRGRFWAFFPLLDEARVPGILNAPWKVDHERTHVQPGPFNEHLAERTAELIVDSLPRLATRDDPAATLDALPREEGGDELAARLAEAVWQRAAEAPIVPDGEGRLRVAGDLALHPSVVPIEVVQRWCEIAPAEARRAFMHPSAQQDRNRLARLRKLREGPGADADGEQASEADLALARWLERAVEPSPDSSRRVLLELVDPLWREAAAGRGAPATARVVLKLARVVLTAAGGLAALGDGALYLPGGEELPEGAALVAEPLADDDAVLAILERFGRRPFDERAQAERFVAGLPPGGEVWPGAVRDSAAAWQAAWGRLRELPPGARRIAIGAGTLLVRTAAGTWQPAADLLLPGGVVPEPLDPRDRHLVVDAVFHAPDAETLRALGLSAWPRLGVERQRGRLQPDAAKLPDDYVRYAIDQFKRCEGNQNAQRTSILVPTGRLLEPSDAPARGSASLRRALTAWALEDPDCRAALEPSWVRHSTPRKYQAVEVRSPLAWQLAERADVELGNQPFVGTWSEPPRPDPAAAPALGPSAPHTIAAGADLEDRLLRAVGDARALLAKLPEVVQHDLRQGPVGDRDLARLFLATHGPDALRVLRDVLRERGLAAPERWGGRSARAYLDSLGFPAEYAEPARGEREPFLLAAGPLPPLRPLHAYQRELLDELASLWRGSGGRRRAMVRLPTGAGKTRLAVEAITRFILAPTEPVGSGAADAPASRIVLWVADRDELCEQAVRCFEQVWAHLGREGEPLRISRLWGATNRRVQPGEPDEPHVVVASIQTLHSALDSDRVSWASRPALTVLDEAHHGVAPSYAGLLRWLARDDGADSGPILGLTATPYRGFNEVETGWLVRRFDGRLFGDGDGSLFARLQGEGVLAHVDHEPLHTDFWLDFDDAEEAEIARFGFSELPDTALRRLADDPGRNDRILDRLLALPEREQALVFACSVEHAQLLAARLVLAGRKAACVVSETGMGGRQRFVADFLAGRLQVLTNYGVLTTGFDAPKVDAILIARPTFSPGLYQQMIGRGLRGPLNGGKERCRLINVIDNLVRYGEKLAFHHFDYLWERGSA